MFKRRKFNVDQTTLKELPDDTMFTFLTFCDLKTLLNSRFVNHEFNDIFKKYKELLFKGLYQFHWDEKLSNEDIEVVENEKDNSWESLFKKRYMCNVKLYNFSKFMKKLITGPKIDKSAAIVDWEIPGTEYVRTKSTGVKLTKDNYKMTREEVKVWENKDFRPITDEEWSRVGFNGKYFILSCVHSDLDTVKKYTNHYGFFTIKDIVNIIEEFDLVDRNVIGSWGEIDVSHVFFEGICKLEFKIVGNYTNIQYKDIPFCIMWGS